MQRNIFVYSIGLFTLLVPFCLSQLLYVRTVEAHTPRVIETPSQNEVMPLSNPDVSQAIYGNLEGYPHMFEFATKNSMQLFVEVLIPDIEYARTNVSGIVLGVNGNGSVREIARLRAKEAAWESFYEWWGGDSYRRGSSFRTQIEPGLYRIEVSTPENIGKYVLVVGTKEEFSLSQYFSLIHDIAEVKAFFGKSRVRVIESPLVFVPVLIILSVGGLFWWRRRVRTIRRTTV